MKRKLLYSAATVVMLVVGLMVPAAPARALYGNMMWQSQPLPSGTGMVLANGTDVSTIRQSGDGSVIYVVDKQTAFGNIYKSTDGGQTFAPTTPPAAVMLGGFDMARDNANVIATTDGTLVYVSTDGGSTWGTLPPLPLQYAGASIRQVTLSPAHAGAILGRLFAIALADPSAGNTARGDVLIIGMTPSWASVAPGITGTRDYINVRFLPGGEGAIAALGTGAAAGSAVIQIINTQIGSVFSTVLLNPAGTTTDYAGPPGPTSIRSGSIAMPSDYDVTTTAGRRLYTAIVSTNMQLDNTVYRVDDVVAIPLGLLERIQSLSYAGTVSGGTLFVGALDLADVRYTTTMTGPSPIWTSTAKLLPVTTTSTFVLAAADFTTSHRVYVGTTGAESAFSVSTNGGISFNQESLIDTGVAANTVNQITGGLMQSPDGKNIFIATKVTNGNISLWTSTTPTSASSWRRIFVAPPGVPASSGRVWVPPDYATTSTIYVLDVAGTAYNIYRSPDGGETWNTRLPPATYAVVQFQDSNIFYWADSAANIYKSIDGGLNWSAPVSTGVTAPIVQIDVPAAGRVIICGTGNIATSTNGGDSFTKIDLNPGEGYRIARDPGFATNNVLYLADSTGSTGKTYRFVLGTDTLPTDLLAPSAGAGSVAALRFRGGVLYTVYSGWNSASGSVAFWPPIPNGNPSPGTRVDRALNPLDPQGMIRWSTVDTPSLPPATAASAAYTGAATTDTDIILYLIFGGAGAPALYAYDDQMGTARAVLTSPASGLTVTPGAPVTLAWNAIGSGTGLATHYQVQITEASLGWAAATTSGGMFVSFPPSPVVIMGPAGQFVFATAANKNYQWRVRAVNEVSGDAVMSNWSDPFTLLTFATLQTTTTSLPGAVVGRAYSANLTATGGTPPCSWAASGLPAGLSMLSTGNITGTPTAFGDFSVNITVTDSSSPANSQSATLALKVLSPGDANGDFDINMGDVTKEERMILGMDPPTLAADANNDSWINMGDVTKTERFILGLP